jgi:hypothetical protein
MPPQPVILESQNATSVADGATIEWRIRISQPDEGRRRCKGQERGISARISLDPRSHLQHIQRPTPSHLSKNTPSLQGVGRADVA